MCDCGGDSYFMQVVENELKAIKQALFARRNGVVADGLRRHGDPHALILGCPLSDIIAVAQLQQPSAELAEALWAEKGHRECRLLAPMLYATDQCDVDTAVRWCSDVQDVEEADVLCHRLLRYAECAEELLNRLLNETDSKMLHYIGFRLLANLVLMRRLTIDEPLRRRIEQELPSATAHPALRQLLNNLLDDDA